MNQPDTTPLIFIVAGEASSDLIGGRLMASLKRRTGGAVRFTGIGGRNMAAEGLVSMFPMSDLSLVGLSEVVPHIPNLWRRMRQTAGAVRRLRPTVVLGIDASGFCRGVARRLQGTGIPLIQYKAPQAWAYWPWRARRMARYFDHLLVILPFEPEFMGRYGATCTFVGHPALESGAGTGDGPGFRRRHGIAAEAPVLCVLPGSRWSEIGWSLGDFRATIEGLSRRLPELRVVVPSIEPVAAAVTASVADWPLPVTVVEGEPERFAAFAASDVALAVSGTVSVELAVAGVPMVVCYRVSAVTAVIARVVLTVRYATVVNLVLDRAAIPEFIQEKCTPDALIEACHRLFTDPGAREAQRADCRAAVAQLGGGQSSPTELAADVVQQFIARAAAAGPVAPEY